MICDPLTVDNGDSITLMLKRACNYVRNEIVIHKIEQKSYKVCILATPLMEERVRQIGFSKDAYDFVFAVHLLSDKVNKKQVAPERWQLSASD